MNKNLLFSQARKWCSVLNTLFGFVNVIHSLQINKEQLIVFLAELISNSKYFYRFLGDDSAILRIPQAFFQGDSGSVTSKRNALQMHYE